MALFALVTYFCCENAYAKDSYDLESSAYGFEVDSEYYGTSYWYNTITTYVKCDGNVIGTNSIDIGMTRSKSTVTGGYYLDQIMVRTAMKGKKSKKGYCGYAEHLTLESVLPAETYLVAYSPESEAGMTSYDIGISADTDKTVGISASTTVTKKALDINNYCDTSKKKFKICYDYKHATLRWNWDTYDKYAYNESIQRAHYTIKSKMYSYKTKLVVKSKFQLYDDVPSYWADPYDEYYTVNHRITFEV